jgi:hypothetical protein
LCEYNNSGGIVSRNLREKMLSEDKNYNGEMETGAEQKYKPKYKYIDLLTNDYN